MKQIAPRNEELKAEEAKRDERLKKLLRMDEAVEFLEVLREWLDIERTSLEIGEGDLLRVGRSQGRIYILKRILNLREEIEDGMV